MYRPDRPTPKRPVDGLQFDVDVKLRTRIGIGKGFKMETQFTTLVRYDSPGQAFAVQEILISAGIDARVVDASSDMTDTRLSQEARPALPMQGGDILLQVPEQQAKEAGDVLAERADDMMGQNPSTQ